MSNFTSEEEEDYVKKEGQYKSNYDDDDDFDDDLDDYNNNKKQKKTKQVDVVLPNTLQTRYYRACYRCHLIKTMDQFNRYGCENCGDQIDIVMQNSKLDKKTFWCKYEGTMAIMDPKQSWVARKITQFLPDQAICPGAYALKVYADTEDIQAEFDACSVAYVINSKI